VAGDSISYITIIIWCILINKFIFYHYIPIMAFVRFRN